MGLSHVRRDHACASDTVTVAVVPAGCDVSQRPGLSAEFQVDLSLMSVSLLDFSDKLVSSAASDCE